MARLNPLLDEDPEDYDPLARSGDPVGDSKPSAKMNPLLEDVSRPGPPQQVSIEVQRPNATATATLATELAQPGPGTAATPAQARPSPESEVVMPAQDAPMADPRIDALMKARAEAPFSRPLITRRGSLREGTGT